MLIPKGNQFCGEVLVRETSVGYVHLTQSPSDRMPDTIQMTREQASYLRDAIDNILSPLRSTDRTPHS